MGTIRKYHEVAIEGDPDPHSLVRWPRWLKAGAVVSGCLANVFAKVRLGRL